MNVKCPERYKITSLWPCTNSRLVCWLLRCPVSLQAEKQCLQKDVPSRKSIIKCTWINMSGKSPPNKHILDKIHKFSAIQEIMFFLWKKFFFHKINCFFPFLFFFFGWSAGVSAGVSNSGPCPYQISATIPLIILIFTVTFHFSHSTMRQKRQ